MVRLYVSHGFPLVYLHSVAMPEDVTSILPPPWESTRHEESSVVSLRIICGSLVIFRIVLEGDSSMKRFHTKTDIYKNGLKQPHRPPLIAKSMWWQGDLSER